MKIAVIAACAALLAACASTEKPSGRDLRVIERPAVVIGVDLSRRLIALQTEDGARAVLPVAEEFHELDDVRVGDRVVVSYTEAVAWQVKPSDKGSPGVSTRETLSHAKPGQSPSGAIERALTVTVTVTAIDAARGTLTISGAQGTSWTVTAHDPAELRKIRVGDLVDITYSEALAVGVRPDTK